MGVFLGNTREQQYLENPPVPGNLSLIGWTIPRNYALKVTLEQNISWKYSNS